MAKSSQALPAKLSTWIIMLLVWNIALLSIAIFYLLKMTQTPLSSADLARECSEAILSISPSL
jgi:hypothetical protein